MRFALTDDQAALRDAIRELLASECPPAAVRAAWPGGDPSRIDRLWTRLAELGLPAAGVPAALGGLGLSEVDLAPLLVELGYAAVPLPVAETAAVAGPLLAATGDPRLSRLVTGELRVSLVGPTGLAPYGGRADLLLELEPDRATLRPASGVEVSTIDGSRALLRLEGGGGSVLTTDPALIGRARDRVTLATAAQLLGLGQRLTDLTVGYVRERRQFGVPVGSFQAVKHRLAGVALLLALAGPAVLAAAWSAAAGGPDRGRDLAAAAVLATEAATEAAKAALQCHGAIGYTVEYDLHLYAKRVWALAAAGPGTEHHLALIADTLDLPEGAHR